MIEEFRRYHESDGAFKGDLAELGIDGEMGTVNPYVSGFGMIHDIQFQNSYTNPVMFAQVTTNIGTNPISVMPTNVQSTWGRLKFYEQPGADGTHYGETIHWMVIDAGTYDLPDGRRLVVGKQSVTTTDAGDLDGVSLEGKFFGDAAVVTSIQSFSNHKYQGTRLEKEAGIDGTVHRFGVRFMGPAGADGNMSGVIGYMALGTPWSQDSGRLTLSKSDGTSVGIDWSQHTNGKCYNLSDEGFDDLATSLTFQAAGYRTGVVVYENAWCTGDQVSVVASGTNTGTLNLATGILANKASSIRVLWTQEQRLYDRGCYDKGEILLENALGWLIFQSDGSLALYRYMPADGSLSVAWQTGASSYAEEACFNDNGNLVVKGTAFGQSVTLWQSGTGNQNVSHMVLQNDCNLVIRNTSGQSLWAAGSNDCWKNVSAATANTMPDFSLGYADVDGDNDQELILIATHKDGSGYFLLDPFGIADFTHNTLGWGLGEADDFWQSLSATQQAVLHAQVSGVAAHYGTTIEGVELEAVLAEGSISADFRSYTSFAFSGSFTGAAGSVSYGVFDASLTIGETEFAVGIDQFGPNFDLSATAATVSVGVGGYVQAEVTIMSAGATFDVDSNAFAIGGGASLVEGAITVGNENATYTSISYGVGVSCYAAARFGKNDQYGFTLDVPVFPIGVAIYVKGAHAVTAWKATSQFTVNVADSTAELASDLWAAAGNVAQSVSSDVVIALEDAASDVAYVFSRAGDELTIMANSAGTAVTTYFTDDVAGAFETVGAAIGDGISDATEAVSTFTEDAGEAIIDTAEDVIEVAEDVAEDAEDAFKSACKWAGFC